MPNPVLHIEPDTTSQRIRIRGPLDISHYRQAETELTQASAVVGKTPVIDLSGVTRLDTAGAFLLHSLKPRPKLEHLRPEHEELFNLIAQAKIAAPPRQKIFPASVQAVMNLGKATLEASQAALAFVAFLGQATVELGKAILRTARFRVASIAHHVEETGINAIPIVSLVAFVISIVIAYQGQVQLKPLGAEQYTVNLIAVSVLREMGVLLTAIMVAGRSGSAFTSEIGVMKVRAEVDALRTIGFNPFELLVLPRLIALIITLPLLTFIADIVGLFGGGMMSLSLLDISFTQYFEQVRHTATWKDFLTGMVKAPVFALIIALVGCRHGLKVSGSAESVGKETTASVVESIFLVLVLDGLFSIYFDKVHL